MFRPVEDDLVVLVEDLPGMRLRWGALGRVCRYHALPAPNYEVEFPSPEDAQAVVRVTVTDEQIRSLVSPSEAEQEE